MGVAAVVEGYKDFVDKVGGMAKSVGDSQRDIGGLGSISLGGLVSSAGIAATAVAAIGAAAVGAGLLVGKLVMDIAEQTAPMLDIKGIYEDLTARAGQSADATLALWQDATKGTIPAIKLMEIYNTSARQLGDTMTQRLPEAFPLLKKAAEATGQDFATFTNTLIKGVGRLRVGTLAQIGVTIDADQVYGDFAATIGKTAAELSDDEKKTALFNASIAQLTSDLSGVDINAEEADDAFERMRVTIQDTKDQIKIAITEAVLPLAVKFAELAKQYLPQLVAVFEEKVIPALTIFVDWLITNLPGAIDAAVKFFGDLQTTGGQLAEYWTTTLQPALQRVAEVVGALLGPYLRTLGVIITQVILPALTLMWNFFSKYILPILRTVANVVGAVLGLALRVLYGIFTTLILPVLEKVWRWISEKLGPIFRWLGEVIQKVSDFLAPFLEGMNDFAGWLNDVKLPAWLTGHSPSPFEKTLAGIRDTMLDINAIGGPGFLGMGMPPLAVAPAGAGGSAGDTFSPAYNLAIHTSAPRENIVADFGLMQALSRRR
jgi:hypothetical protein